MKGKDSLFVLRYNQRDDDLGDQFIFKALADSLSEFGTVVTRRQPPSFTPNLSEEGGQWAARLTRLLTSVRGGTIFNVLPPGALLRPKPKSDASSDRASSPLKAWLDRHTTGKKVSVGRSVIPDADHSWCRSLDWVGIRDDASIQSMREAGYSHVTYFPDLAFMVPSSIPDDRADVIERIGLSFRREIPEDTLSGRYEEVLTNAISTLVGHLGETENTLAYHQVEEDAEYVASIVESFGLQRKHEPITLDTYQPFYRKLDLVVSNRLHCLLMGALCGAIPIAFTTREHTKVVSLYETIGWHSLLLFAEEPQEIEGKLQSIRQRVPELRSMVESTLVDQRNIGREALSSMIGN